MPAKKKFGQRRDGLWGGLAGVLLWVGWAAVGWALPAAPTHYAVTGRTPASMTLTGLATVDGVPAGAGVEIAVYDVQNVLCGVSGVDTANGGAFILHVYGDDPTTPADEGMTAGDVLRFEVWNPVGPTVVPHASLRFSPAAFGTAPPAYPPVFGDRAAYSLNLATNRAPALTAVGPKTVAENALLSFAVSATDADGDTLTYSTSALPTGAAFNATTRIFTWTPDYTQAGSYNVTFTASDGSLTAAETVAITVTNTNRAPVLTAIGPKTVAENALLSFAVSATDADGNTLTYSTSALPTGAAFNATTRTFTWTPGYTQAGSYAVTFTASDGSLTASEAVAITVTNTNRAPVLTAIGPKTVAENALLSFAVSATDADGNTLTYSTSALPIGAAFNATTRTFSWTPGYTQAGSYPVTFTVSDGSLTASEVVTMTVTDVNRAPVLAAIGNRSVSENQLLTFVVSATDADGNTLTYSTSVLPTGATFNAATRTFAWTPAFEQVGNYSVTFTVTDAGTPPLSASETVVITVGDVNRPPTLAPVGAKAVTEGVLLSFTLSATDPDLPDSLTYSAGALPAGAAFDPATRTFSWTPQYGQEGAYAVTFTVTDNGTPQLSDAEVVTINVGPAIVTLSIPLQAGWNLVSFPLALCSYTGGAAPSVPMPPGTPCLPAASIGDFFAGIAGQYERIESFDATGAHAYDPNLPAYLNDLTYVAGGYGYRIKMKQASVLTLTGRRIPPATALSLPGGWVLAGYWGLDVLFVGAQPTVAFPAGVSFKSVASISSVFPSLGGSLGAVWSTDALGDHTYYPAGPASPSPVLYIGPGYGYWLKVAAPATLSFDLP